MSGLRTGIGATVAAALLSGTSVAAATSFYVSPTGTTSTGAGTGTITNPWSLQTALSQPAAVHAGDTIWLRGGTYRGTFNSHVSGTASQPIIVRQYPGERAILDGGNSAGSAILSVTGAYTWYWGFEIMSSNTVRVASTDGDNPPEIVRGEGIAIVQSSSTGAGLKFINLVIHDALQGIALWIEAVDAEVYGCLIYYNGWDSPSRGSGHGIYTQNEAGTKKITDNIIFSGYGHGIHANGSSAAFLDNFLFQGNTLFNSGNLSSTGPSRELLVGGGSVAHNPQVLGNFLYRQGGGLTSDFDMGYDAGCASPTVTNNYIVATTYFVNCTSGLTMTGNTFYGARNFSQSAFPSNTYLSSRPTGVQVFVRPNQYESGRGNVTVYNWDLGSIVSVDLSGVVSIGANYEIRNAQNYFGSPVLTGTYAGGAVSLPMTGLTPATPIGATAPNPSGPEFNAFIVLPVGGGAPPPPPVAAFTFSPASPQTNTALTFTDTSTGSPTSWQWTFGDGGASALRNPTHTFAVAGSYTVTLTATNAGGSNQTARSVAVTAPSMAATPTRFYTVAPCRLIDTRNPVGPVGGPALAATSARTFPVAARCGVPSDARAVSGNVLVVSPAAAGFVTAYPGNLAVPQTTVINFRGSQTRSNNAVVSLATDGTGTIRVWNGSDGVADFVLDVNGYFK